MTSKEDYIILLEVLRKMEYDINYKATYAEETALTFVFEQKFDEIFKSIECIQI